MEVLATKQPDELINIYCDLGRAALRGGRHSAVGETLYIPA
jgi:hypothetical protein